MSELTTTSPIAQIDQIDLPDFLDGSAGSNRSTVPHAQIAANTDIDAIKVWLARFRDTRTTFDNYRKEAERLLLWSTVERGKPLSSGTGTASGTGIADPGAGAARSGTTLPGRGFGVTGGLPR